MDLKTSIMQELKAAMKDRDKVRVAALRLIRDAVQKTELDSKTDLDDHKVIEVLSKLEKKRKESIEAFQKAEREDLVGKETRELEIIREFMPAPFSKEELSDLVEQAISETRAQSPSEMGKVMKSLKGRYEGRATGADVSQEVKRQLSEMAGS